MVDKFNIRVYGILVKENKILLSHENIDDFEMVKLPGGGLELGEGLVEALKREFIEEVEIQIEVEKLVHVTNGFIQSVFRKNEQIVAVHYQVSTANNPLLNEKIHQTNVGSSNKMKFVWHHLDASLIENMTFEMDKEALKMLLVSK